MPFKSKTMSNNETLSQLAGITGLGWTASLFGFISTMIGYGSNFVPRLIAGPQSFLYLGAVFFLATLGLDRLNDRRADDRD